MTKRTTGRQQALEQRRRRVQGPQRGERTKIPGEKNGVRCGERVRETLD